MKKSLKSLFKKKKKVGEKVSPEFERAGGRQTLKFLSLGKGGDCFHCEYD